MFTLVPFLKSRDEFPERTPRLIPPKSGTNPDKRSLGRLRDLNFVDPELLEYYRKKGGYTGILSKYPGRNTVRKGLLTENGIRSCFAQLFGRSLPNNAILVFGNYNIRQYHDWSTSDFNSHIHLYFQINPGDTENFIEEAVANFTRMVRDLEVSISEQNLTVPWPFRFLNFLRELCPYRSMEYILKMIKYNTGLSLRGDPKTGNISVDWFAGDED